MMGLKPALEGRRFTHVETRRGDLRIPFPKDFAKRLTGRTVKRMWRRAKYIMADLEGGETLVIHLGMSGRMSVAGAGIGAFHHASRSSRSTTTSCSRPTRPRAWSSTTIAASD